MRKASRRAQRAEAADEVTESTGSTEPARSTEPALSAESGELADLERQSGRYSTILRLPGAAAFTSAGILARMPFQGAALAVTLAVVMNDGSYVTAGLLVAVMTIGRAISAPTMSRLVDHYGQAAVMIYGVSVQFITFGALTFGIALDWSLVLLNAFALVTGLAFGAPHAYVRARWVHIAGNRRQLDTAFAWESMIESFGVALTPLIIVLLVNAVSPLAGLVFLTAVTAVGGVALYTQKRTEPPVVRNETGGRVRIAGRTARRILVFTAYNFSGSFVMGSLSIIAVQQEEATSISGYSGFVLTSFALGTLVAAYAYGAVSWKRTPDMRLRAIVPVFALTVLTVPFLENSLLLLAAAFIIGFPFIGILTSSNRAVQEVAPKGRLTELLAWLGFAQATGVALGSLLMGIAIDGHGYVVAALVLTLAGAFAMLALAYDVIVYRPTGLATTGSTAVSPKAETP